MSDGGAKSYGALFIMRMADIADVVSLWYLESALLDDYFYGPGNASRM